MPLLLLFCFGNNLPAQVDLDRGLVGYWPFDSSGVNESPNLLPRTDFSFFNTSFSYGIEGSAASFRALNFYGNGHVTLEQGIQSPEVSFSLWFNTDDARGGTLLAWDNKGYGATLSAGGKINAYACLSGNNRYDFVHNGKNLADGQWHNLVVSFGNSVFRVYLDGSEIHHSSDYGLNKQLFYEAGSINLGGVPTDDDKKYYTGRIDELLIYNRALTQQEINIIAGKGQVQADNDLETGLMVFLPFDNEDVNKSLAVVESTRIQGEGGIFSPACISGAPNGRMKFLKGKGEYLYGGPALAFPVFSLNFFMHTTSTQTGHVAGWDTGAYQIVLNPAGNPGKLLVRLWVSKTEEYVCITGKSLNDGVCHHVSVSFDGQFFRVFIDGQREIEDGKHGPRRSVFYPGEKFMIGEAPNSSSGIGFQGKIGQLSLYCRALSKKEIEALDSDADKQMAPTPVCRKYACRSNGHPFIAISNTTGKSQKVMVTNINSRDKKPVLEKKMLPDEHLQERLPVSGKLTDFKVEYKK